MANCRDTTICRDTFPLHRYRTFVFLRSVGLRSEYARVLTRKKQPYGTLDDDWSDSWWIHTWHLEYEKTREFGNNDSRGELSRKVDVSSRDLCPRSPVGCDKDAGDEKRKDGDVGVCDGKRKDDVVGRCDSVVTESVMMPAKDAMTPAGENACPNEIAQPEITSRSTSL